MVECPKGKLDILIADDEVYIRDFLYEILSDSYTIHLASDGEEALRILISKGPALAILDVSMPGMSGLEVCKTLRRTPKTGHTKVIVITAFNSPEKKSEAIAAGANDFLPKPFHPDELLAKIKACLKDE